MIYRLFSYIENQNISANGWFVSILSIVGLRMFLENFSGAREGAVFVGDIQTYIHYTLFYLVTIGLFVSLVHFFTHGKKVWNIAKVFGFGLILTLLPPIIDFIVSGGAGTTITYVFGTPWELFINFITFYGRGAEHTATLGIRVELVIVFVSAFLYFRYLGATYLRSIFGTFALYAGLFLLATLPNYLFITNDITWVYSIKNSVLGNNLIHPLISFKSVERVYEMYFNGAMSSAYYLLLIPITAYVSYAWNREKFMAILKNSRWERVAHYFLMIILGGYIAYSEGLFLYPSFQWVTVAFFITLFFSFYAVWMYAVCLNDVVDYVSDKISNPNRPIVKGVVTPIELQRVGYMFLMLAVTGGFLLGYTTVFLILIYAGISYIYSHPPFQLKRFAIINSALIASASLVAVLAGFFAVSNDPRIDAFPLTWLIIIFVLYTLFANVKDIKDIEGDRAVKVYTIPVLLGERKGILTIWGLITVGLLCIPLLLNQPILWIPSLVASAVLFFLLQKKPFVERYIFITYFVYAILAGLLYVLTT